MSGPRSARRRRNPARRPASPGGGLPDEGQSGDGTGTEQEQPIHRRDLSRAYQPASRTQRREQQQRADEKQDGVIGHNKPPSTAGSRGSGSRDARVSPCRLRPVPLQNAERPHGPNRLVHRKDAFEEQLIPLHGDLEILLGYAGDHEAQVQGPDLAIRHARRTGPEERLRVTHSDFTQISGGKHA